jgi:hypothetical protein
VFDAHTRRKIGLQTWNENYVEVCQFSGLHIEKTGHLYKSEIVYACRILLVMPIGP